MSRTHFKVTHSEERVYHEQLKYAGTLDVLGSWKGTSWLIDLKSGAVPRSVGAQTAAYREACTAEPQRRMALQLKPNDYKLIPCNDPSDFHLFTSCLNIHNFLNRGREHAGSENPVSA